MAAFASFKRLLIGNPRATGELGDQVLPPWLALPVFASDTLSAVAYATEEMLIVLALAGAASFGLVEPLSAAVAALMVIVIASYRQTVRAYPGGGGAYVVAQENLGERAGLVAASALLIDYTLTVAVSVAAGTAAIVSAFPALQPARVVVAVAMLAIITVTNLRGVREVGLVVAVPAYAFVVIMLALIARGVVMCVGGCPSVPFEPVAVPAEVTSLGALLILRAFATGATALTGVEAVSNGVPAFTAPASRNAARTLTAIGVIALPLLLGIGWLANNIEGIVAFAGLERTVTSQIAAAVFGPASPGFYAVQVLTASILFLAANTAYADFPRLASVLADDRYLPRQLASRGDRLVFSNGIIVLSAAAGLLIVVSGARVTFLVALFVVGVFSAFTLSQAGMVRYWLANREARWGVSVALNGVGAVATASVLIVVLVTKFVAGAWIVLVAAPLLVAGMLAVRRHYAAYADTIAEMGARAPARQPIHTLLMEDRVDSATAAAVAYAYGIGSADVEAFLAPSTTRRSDVRERWRELAPRVEVTEYTPGLRRSAQMAMREAAGAFADAHAEDGFGMVLIPETRSDTWLDVIRRHGLAQRLKAGLVGQGQLVVTNVVAPIGGPGPYQVLEPVEHHVVVLVNQVHDAAVRAVSYAMSLQATTVQALTVNVSGERSREILQGWQRAGIPIPLEIIDSPYRSLVESVSRYVADFRPDGQHTVVTVVMSEFVLSRWWQRSLHNQTVLQLKSSLLFSRGVVTTSVPTPLTVDPRRRVSVDSRPDEAGRQTQPA